MPRPERLFAAALALVLVVVVASAAIRLGASGAALGVLRIAHRTAATLEVLIVAVLAWQALRTRRPDRALVLAAAVTLLLAVIGIAAGRNPPPAAIVGNIVGGLALAACFAWMLGRKPLAGVAVLIALQCVLGSVLAADWRASPPEIRVAHALLGMALALGSAMLAARAERPATRLALMVVACAVPAAGIATAVLERGSAAALAHAVAVALFVSLVAFAQPRLA